MTQDNPDTTSGDEGVGLSAGTRIGKYEIVQRIGTGGQSVVYKGRDKLLDRFVAIKQISTHLGADERFVKRFRAEAKILAQLGGERSNIVAVYDLIEHELGLFIAMEHVEGHPLSNVLAYQEQALPVDVTIDILLDIANGLRVAHAAGIVHRDIKPGNVIVTRTHTAKITDFGVAAQAGEDDSLSLGTTKYMAPEVFSNATVDGRIDIYSLGFLAYEMLTGREFFRKIFADVLRDPHSENLRWMKWHSDPDLAPPLLAEINPMVSPRLADCVARMMAKDPQQRYATVDEVIADLTAVQKGSPAAEPVAAGVAGQVGTELEALAAESFDELPTSVVPRKPIPTRTKLVAAGIVVGLLVIIGAALAIVMGGHQQARAAEANAAYDAAGQAYTAAEKLYHDDGKVSAAVASFADAQQRFEQYITQYGDLPRGTGKPRAWGLLSQAYQAMLKGDFATPEVLAAEAEKLGALRKTVIEEFMTAHTVRDDAVATLNQMERALATGDLGEAGRFADQFGDLDGPPMDQNLRAQKLAQRLKVADTEAKVKRALAAGDAAMANAEAAASADRAEKFVEALRHLDGAEEGFAEARMLAPDDPAVRKRVTALRQARSYVSARAVYIKRVTEGQPLADQVQALKAVVASRPPSDELVDELATAQAEEAYQRAAKLMQSQRRRDLEGARGALVEAVAYKKLPKAVAALDDVEKHIEHLRLVAQAKRATRNGRFAEAVQLLQQAEQVRYSEQTAGQLSAARVTWHMADGDAARKAKSWAEALAHYEKARQVRLDDEDLSVQVDQRADLAGREREYYQLLDLGRQLLAATDYRKAVSKLGKAEQLGLAEGMDVPVEEASRQRMLARYQWEVAKGKARAVEGNLRAALGFYRVAQNLIDTAEVRELIVAVAKQSD